MEQILAQLFANHDLVTPKEVSLAFGVSKSTIRRKIKHEGIIPIGPNTSRLTREQVRRLFPTQA